MDNEISTSKKPKPIIDEREKSTNEKALAGAAVCAILFDIVMMIYYIVNNDIMKSIPYIIQLVLMGIVISMIKTRNNDFQIPRTYSGRQICTEQTSHGKLNRCLYYFTDSIVFAVVFAAFEYLISKDSITSAVISLGAMFVVSFIIDYVSCERKVKKYNKLLNSMEDDE